MSASLLAAKHSMAKCILNSTEKTKRSVPYCLWDSSYSRAASMLGQHLCWVSIYAGSASMRSDKTVSRLARRRFSQKLMNEFVLFAVKPNSFVRFLGETMADQSA